MSKQIPVRIASVEDPDRREVTLTSFWDVRLGDVFRILNKDEGGDFNDEFDGQRWVAVSRAIRRRDGDHKIRCSPLASKVTFEDAAVRMIATTIYFRDE